MAVKVVGLDTAKHVFQVAWSQNAAVHGARSVVYRECGVSKHTLYAWKSKYGGMDVSEAQEVKQLREENSLLKKLVADLSLDKDILASVSMLVTRGPATAAGDKTRIAQTFAPITGFLFESVTKP
jgi:transposase-like protein